MNTLQKMLLGASAALCVALLPHGVSAQTVCATSTNLIGTNWNVATLNGTTSVGTSQDVQTVPGSTYYLSFKFAPKLATTSASSSVSSIPTTLDVFWNASQIAHISRTSTANSTQLEWLTYLYTVKATASTTHLEFQDGSSVSPLGINLDDVRLCYPPQTPGGGFSGGGGSTGGGQPLPGGNGTSTATTTPPTGGGSTSGGGGPTGGGGSGGTDVPPGGMGGPGEVLGEETYPGMPSTGAAFPWINYALTVLCSIAVIEGLLQYRNEKSHS